MRSITVKALAIAVIAGLAAGCATGGRSAASTAPASNLYAVQGRDMGRGGATSGGVSSLDPTGNAADYSLYDEAHPDR